jgi:hypothetical protein
MSSVSFTNPEGKGHGERLYSSSGDECVRRASRQRQGPRRGSSGSPCRGLEPSGPPPPTMRSTHRSGRLSFPRRRCRCTSVFLPPPSGCLPNSPLAKCGCKRHALDLYGDHTSTCTAHSGAIKAHDWMVSVLGPLFCTADGHTVRTQHGMTASAGQQRGDVEIRDSNYLRDSAGPRSLVFDLSIAHDRFGSSSHVLQNCLLTHPQDLDGPLRVAAQRKINAYGQQYADNQNIPFLPAIMSTSCRMHGEFLRLIFLQAHRETEAHFSLQLECHRQTIKRTRSVSSARRSCSP